MNGVTAAPRPTAPANQIRNLNIPSGGGGRGEPTLALLQISQLEIFYRNSFRRGPAHFHYVACEIESKADKLKGLPHNLEGGD